MRLVPAPRGTGLVAARVPKKVLQMAGVEDVFTSSSALVVFFKVFELNQLLELSFSKGVVRRVVKIRELRLLTFQSKCCCKVMNG